MKFHPTTIDGAWLIELEPAGDERGLFARTYCAETFAARGLNTDWPQQNWTLTRARGTVRGMHYQRDPHAEIKVVRCTAGAVYDVVIDLRPTSPSYLKWEAFELSEENFRQLYIPAGCAHGFQTLREGCQLHYQMSAAYHPESAAGVRWDDPAFGITWPVPGPLLSERDRGHPDFEPGSPAGVEPGPGPETVPSRARDLEVPPPHHTKSDEGDSSQRRGSMASGAPGAVGEAPFEVIPASEWTEDPRRILVTGGTGFVGSAFVRAALARGHSVGALVREKPGGARRPRFMDHARLEIIPGELSAPPWDALEDFRPDVCLHAAWVATPGVYLDSPENADHLRWGLKLLGRMLENGAGVVGVGTCLEYELAGAGPLSEEGTAVKPLSPYARFKHTLNLGLQRAGARAGSPVAWARLFYPYGAGEHPARLCSSAAVQLAAGEELALKTPASTKDYIHVEDVARGLLALVEARAEGTFNLGTGRGVSVREIASRIGALIGGGAEGRVVDDPEGGVDPFPSVVADVGKLRALGWEPRVELEDGLRELVASLVGAAGGR